MRKNIIWNLFSLSVLLACAGAVAAPGVTGNSSRTPLGANETFTGTWEDISNDSSIVVAAKADQDGTLYVDFSDDCSTSLSTLTYSVTGGINEVHRLTRTRKCYRVRFTNGSVAQGSFWLSTDFDSFNLLASPLNQAVQQDADTIIVRNVDYFTEVNDGKYTGKAMVQKFGSNADVDAAEDIWDGGGDYTGWPSSAEAVEVLSSSVNDTAAGTGARTVKIFGLDANYALQEETVTLNGTTPVDTVNTYLRVYRMLVITAGSGTTNAGTITARQTTTTSNVFTVMQIGTAQSEITAYTIPAGYTGYLLHYDAQMRDTQANSSKVAIKVRELNSAVRQIRQFAVATTQSFRDEVIGGLKFPEKTDFVFRAVSVANANADISVTWDMIIIKN